MQETDFIQQNKDKWKEFEEVLNQTEKDPERLTDLFIETTDDLSYSRTYYPNRSVRVYLNGISRQIYQAIYKNKSREKNAFIKFWQRDLPEAMWYSRKGLLLSFALFSIGLSIGVLSSIYYPDFAKIILGNGYVEMTKANIESGDPMAVYKDSEPFVMFFQIAWNNIQIAYGTFILGILLGIGTIYVILYNSVMVGAFIYFFVERGLFKESFLAIMLHGTLELSMIVVAGCAGFTLARGLIFPGTYTRSQALIRSARSGIKILIGVTVLLIYAAIIESFATRHTEVPDIIRLFIIILSAVLVFGYFVWYPRYLYKNGRITNVPIEEDPVPNRITPEIHRIKSAGRIFTESFTLFTTHIRTIIFMALGATVILTIYFGLAESLNYNLIYKDSYLYSSLLGFLYPYSNFAQHVDFVRYPLLYPLIAILFSLIAIKLFSVFNINNGVGRTKARPITYFNSFIITCTGMLPLLLPASLTLITIWIWFPICLLWLYSSFNSNQIFVLTLQEAFRVNKGNFWKLTGVFMSLTAINWAAYMLLTSDIIFLIGEFIQTNIPRNMSYSEQIPYIVATFLTFFVPAVMLTVYLFGIVLFYYSARETNQAEVLRKQISHIGFKKRAYGLEKEI